MEVVVTDAQMSCASDHNDPLPLQISDRQVYLIAVRFHEQYEWKKLAPLNFPQGLRDTF